MQTSLCRSANLACAARPSKAAGARIARRSSVVVRAEGEAPAKWSPPALDANTPSPTFGGSTGGLLRKAQVEEFYVLTWENPGAEVPFEMPTGGTAIMRAGANLLKLARKEQALALLTSLKAKNKVKVGNIYRLLPSGETQHLHPKDGTVPERVNAGRAAANTNARRIGDNKSPAQIKFTGKLGTFDV